MKRYAIKLFSVCDLQSFDLKSIKICGAFKLNLGLIKLQSTFSLFVFNFKIFKSRQVITETNYNC